LKIKRGILMFIVATGINDLDNQLKDRLQKDGLEKIEIVYYRDYLFKSKGNIANATIILSPYLQGSIPLDTLLFELKKNDARIILLLDTKQNELFIKALKLGIYDTLFDDEKDGITIDDIVHLIHQPKKLMDYEKYIKQISGVDNVLNLEDVTGDSKEEKGTQDASVGQEKVQEKVMVKKEYIKEFVPVKYIFKKQVISVIGNTEFACEFAYCAARLTKHNVIFLNLDKGKGHLDIYLGIDDEINVEESNKESYYCVKPAQNLSVIPAAYNIASPDITAFMQQLYSNYDIIIINLPEHSNLDELKSIITFTDRIIVPVLPSAVGIKEAKAIISDITARYSLLKEKVKIVGWEYKKGINYDKSDMKTFCGDMVIGMIPYDVNREKARNDVPGFYSKRFYKDIKKIYQEILMAIGIVPKESFFEKVIKALTLRKQLEKELETYSDEIEKAKENEHNLYMQSIIDPLTQIYNRRYFEDRLQRDIEEYKQANKPLCLMLLDIDYFKKINDTYGHDTGDKILIQFAKKVKSCTKKTDTFARIGGEEFAIILYHTTLDEAKTVAERIRIAIKEEHWGEVDRITCSIGIALMSEDDTKETLYKKADNALYCAKEEGRDCVRSTS